MRMLAIFSLLGPGGTGGGETRMEGLTKDVALRSVKQKHAMH